MDPREEDVLKVHGASIEIATMLGTALMNMMPVVTAKYALNLSHSLWQPYKLR